MAGVVIRESEGQVAEHSSHASIRAHVMDSLPSRATFELSRPTSRKIRSFRVNSVWRSEAGAIGGATSPRTAEFRATVQNFAMSRGISPHGAEFCRELQNIAAWRSQTDNWRSQMQNWRSFFDPWHSEIDHWRSQFDPWRTDADLWRSHMKLRRGISIRDPAIPIYGDLASTYSASPHRLTRF